MNPKQEVLQVLFESNVFTGNFSELARKLGYASGGRSTIERIKRGNSELSEKKLDALIETLCEEYLITENDIITIARSVLYGKDLLGLLRKSYGTGEAWHKTVLGAIFAEKYSELPELDEKFFIDLQELKLQEPDIYYGMLACCYIQCKGIFPYTNAGRKALPKQLHGLNELLKGKFPGSNNSYESSRRSIEINLADKYLTTLKLIYTLRVVIRGYVDVTYFEEFLRSMGHLLPVDEDSFWTTADETFHEGCELWYLRVIPTKSHERGAYTAMRLRAKSPSTESFELTGGYNFMFLIDENYDNLHILQAVDLPTGKVEYAQYFYDGEKRMLELCFDGAPEKTFNLPTELYCINHTAPQGKEEKIWVKIIEKLRDRYCEKFLFATINSSAGSNIEYLTKYDVTNVCIDRKNITVTIDYGDEEKSYTIPACAHPFFAQLTPKEYASVVHFKDSGELAVAWNYLGQYIPLKEFNEK